MSEEFFLISRRYFLSSAVIGFASTVNLEIHRIVAWDFRSVANLG